MKLQSISRHALALLFLAPLARANTYIVDAAGGGAFTDIQTAILATQPGDVLLVQAGTYAPFALDRGLTIIGYGACNVSGPISIAGLPAGQTCAMVRIESASLGIQGCGGHVIVQDMHQLIDISVSSSADVRFARVDMPGFQAPAGPAVGLALQSSRLEVASSTLRGQWAPDCASPALDGADGVQCGTSRLHLARSTVWGGNGSSCAQQYYNCAPGGDGIELQGGADVIVCGRGTDNINAGFGGINFYYNECTYDSIPGNGILLLSGSQLRCSGVQLHGWDFGYGLHCVTLHSPEIANVGGVVVQPPIPDPTLSVSGNPAAGSSVLFTTDGPAGATVVLSFGRNPVVQPDPNTVIEVLVPPLRNVNLGTIGASGHADFTWPISSVLLPGTRMLAQARVTLTSGEVRRTNSVPVILR